MEISGHAVMLLPLVLGLVQVAKMSGLNSRYAPALSLVLGILGSALIVGIDAQAIVQGAIVGLMASGMWSGAKATLQ